MKRRVPIGDLPPEERRITRIIDRLAERGLYEHARIAARNHHTTVEATIGKTRKKSIVAARHDLLTRLHDAAGLSWPEIAEIFETTHDNIMVRSREYKERRTARTNAIPRRIADFLRRRGHPEAADLVESGAWLDAPPPAPSASGTRLRRAITPTPTPTLKNAS